MRSPYALDRLADHGIKVVPTGWTVSRVKYLATYKNGYPFKPDEWGADGAPIIRIQNLTNDSAEPNRFLGELDESFKVRRGDLLISWSASLGLHTWNGEDGWLNQHIFKVDLNYEICTPSFFKWLATWFMGELQRDAHGSTMQHLTKDAFGSFPVMLPPKQLQDQIAQRLQDRVSSIDRLIDAKAALLESLAEKRRALVAQAVTRGLNPSAPLRDSNIEWLGSIPAHWRTENTKWLFNEIDDRSEDGTEELLTVSHLTGVTTRAEKDVNMFMAESNEGYKRCRAGDLVINTLWAWMGAMGVAKQDGIVSPAYNVYRPMQAFDLDYLDHLVRTPLFAAEITRYSKGVWSSRMRLYPEGLYEASMPVPPLAEQVQIAQEIAHKIQHLDALSSATKDTIGLLEERRTALIERAISGHA